MDSEKIMIFLVGLAAGLTLSFFIYMINLI